MRVCDSDAAKCAVSEIVNALAMAPPIVMYAVIEVVIRARAVARMRESVGDV